MPGPWNRDNNREQGRIGELPLGGLLSELLASEGVDPGEFADFLQESLQPTIAADPAIELLQEETAQAEVQQAEPLHEEPVETMPGLPEPASQLSALNQAATAYQDTWAPPEAPDTESEPPATPEAHDLALPGLLLSLTAESSWTTPESAEEPMPEPAATGLTEFQPEPEPEPAPADAPRLEAHVLAVPVLPIEILEAPAEDTPDVQVPLPHGRAHDLSNLIGAIDSEIAAAPELPTGSADTPDEKHERFVCFRLGGISFGLHMRLVREVERVGRVTQVPGAPRLVCGLLNLRGEILPLIDTRILLNLEPAAWPPSGYLLVVQPDPQEQPLALLVDELAGVAIVDPAAVETDLADLEQPVARHAIGMAEHRSRVVLLLDHRNLVTPEALMASAQRGSLN